MTPTAGGHQRLRRGPDITRVMRGRQQRAGRLLVAHVAAGGEVSAPARVAVIASRRVGNAVARNRCKRLLREAARHCALHDGVDLVLVARANLVSATLDEVHRELEVHLNELGAMEPLAAAGR